MATNNPSRKYNFGYLGGAVFSADSDWSNREALWSELFKEKERVAMRRHMASRFVGMSIGHNFQVQVRFLFTKEAVQPKDPRVSGDNALKGEFVLLCHGYHNALTSSWTWAKMAYPLYKAGFSVIFVDLPGFGVSGMGNNANVPLDQWVERDWKVIVELLTEMSIRRVHLVTYGESSNILFRMLAYRRNALEMTHICLNPMLDIDSIIPLRYGPGMKEDEIAQLKRNQQRDFNKLIFNAEVRIWCLFDRAESHLTSHSMRLLGDYLRSPYSCGQISITQLPEQHVSSASVGSTVPTQILFLSRWLKSGCVRCLMKDSEFKPPSSLIPEHADFSELDTEDWPQSPAGISDITSSSFYPLGGRRTASGESFGSMQDAFSMTADSWGAANRAWGAGSEAGGSQDALTTWTSGFYRRQSKLSQSALSQSTPSIRPHTQTSRTTSSVSGVVKHTSKLFSSSPRDEYDSEGLIPRPVHMDGARALASKLQLPDLRPERRALLLNVKAVTKSKNVTEIRNAEAGTESVLKDALPEERVWLEDALDVSMMTLQTDEDRRKQLAIKAQILEKQKPKKAQTRGLLG